MKILRTGHEIADTVAHALEEGLYGKNAGSDPIPIGYGILRGTAENFKASRDYFHLDRGYFKPSHYDGYYRISLNGTQQTIGLDKLQPDYERLEALKLDMKPWRGFDKNKPALVCPPSQAVVDFFGNHEMSGRGFYEIREKGSTSPINFEDYNYVLTFNSSVGWQALQAGIPCVSDTTHSIVGSYYKNILLENLSDIQYVERNKLFGIMAGLQLRLDEIRAGAIWGVLQKLIASASTSDGIHASL